MWFDKDPKNMKVRKRGATRGAGTVLNVSSRNRKAKGASGAPMPVLWFSGVAIALVVIWGCVTLARQLDHFMYHNNDRFVLANVIAKTDGVMPEELLLEWTGIDRSGKNNLFDIDLEAVREAVEDVPVIQRAVVRRELPDTLVVMVKERTPIARLGRDAFGLNFLVDADGVIVNKSFQAKHLPYILGVTSYLEPGENIYETRAKEALQALDMIRRSKIISQEVEVRRVSVGHKDYLDFRLANGKRLLLNRTDLGGQLTKAARALQEDRARGLNSKTIDCRPEGGHVIGTPD